ncbi:MAG: hypothetical protein U1C56_01745, partial [Candidatus Curtissbacteria bacterium]|nr:hypothetical protein [Candidatus Curtissbacteria bacterium]
ASKMLEKMGELKRMSKTGSTGLGQLTEKEGQTLRDASTALSRDLPADKALEYLNDMERIYEKLLNPPKLKGSDSSGIQERSIPQKTIGRFIVEEVD